MNKEKIFSVYFLTDCKTKTYIGYTCLDKSLLQKWKHPVAKRFRTHCFKLKNSAKRTKQFDTCRLVTFISGFPDNKTALSYEWFAKRRKLKCHRNMATFFKNHGHMFPIHSNICSRLDKFFAPLNHSKFTKWKNNLTIFIDFPFDLSGFYKIKSKPLPFPTCKEHFTGKPIIIKNTKYYW